MQNLTLLTEQIETYYGRYSRATFRMETLQMQETGLLKAGSQEYLISRDGLKQFARQEGVPADFFAELDPDIRALIFNRRLEKLMKHQDITLVFDNQNHIVGFDDPQLFHISPLELLEILYAALPGGLVAEEIAIGRLYLSDSEISFSCYSPQIQEELLPGDIINGGIDIHHALTGICATQVRCYLRRLVCSNGATVHICSNQQSLRSRRLANRNFQAADMVQQLRTLFQQAFQQLEHKLAALHLLLKEPMIDLASLEQVRAKYSLNNTIISQIENALPKDPRGPTGTQYDVFNAISFVATHHAELTLRQQRTLLHMAGEISQSHVRQCSQCGTWIQGK